MALLQSLTLVLYLLCHCFNPGLGEELPLSFEQHFECGGLSDRCVDSTTCKPILKLMQGSDDDASIAQFTYCGERTDNWVDKDNLFGYGPIKGAIGPPMSCCDQRDIMEYPSIDQICSSKIPALRAKRCGLTPMFYLNKDVKSYLKSEYDYRFKQTISARIPCVHNSKNYKRLGRRRRRACEGTSGSTRRQKRFVGGFKARMAQFPYIAVIYHRDYIFRQKYVGCLATIIHPQFLLSTKECVNRAYIDEIWAGAYQYSNDSRIGITSVEMNDVIYNQNINPQKRYYEFAINYEVSHKDDKRMLKDYNGTFLDPFGISIIRVDSPFQFNDFVQPVCLPLQNYRYDYTTFGDSKISVGYGFRSASKVKGVLHYGYLRKARNCYKMLQNYFGKKYAMRDRRGDTIWDCLEPTEGVQPCYLDDGGPLLRMNQEGFLTQTGILMRAPQAACGHPDFPVVYLELYRFISWFPKVFAKALLMKKPSRDDDHNIDVSKLPSYNETYRGHCLTEFEKRILDKQAK